MSRDPFADVDLSERQAVRGLQQLINLMSPTAGVSVDGVIGPQTRKAFSELPEEATTYAQAFIASRNPGLIEKLETEASPSTVEGKVWFTLDELRPIMRSAAQRFDVPLEVLEFFLGHEPAKKRINGVMHYNANSRSGSYAGIMQMGDAAWTDALREENEVTRESGSRSPLSGVNYETGKYRVVPNIYAAAAYARANREYARRYGYRGPMSKELYYAGHNQGTSFWYDGMRQGTLPVWAQGQSGKAKGTLDTALRQLLQYA